MLQVPSLNPTRDFLWDSGLFSETKPWWASRYAWDHRPVGKSSDTQASASSHEIFSSGFLILDRIHLAFQKLQVSSAKAEKSQRIIKPPPCFSADWVFFSAYASFLLLQMYQVWKVPVLFHHSAEQNPITSAAYLYSSYSLSILDPTFLVLLGQ